MKLWGCVFIIMMVCGAANLMAQKEVFTPADLIVKDIGLDKDCVILFTLKNQGGSISSDRHANCSVRITYGHAIEEFFLGKESASRKPAVDPAGELRNANGTVTYVTGIKLSDETSVTVVVNANGVVTESNKNNNALKKKLTPNCMLVAQPVLKLERFVQSGWCCRNNEVVSSTNVQCQQDGGTFYADQQKAQQSCPQKMQQLVFAGACCLNGEILRISHRECSARRGKYYEDAGEAQSKCTPAVQEAPQQGWCCINGEIPQMTERECKQQNGKYHDSLKSAEKKCKKLKEEKAPEAGWCCINGEIPQMTERECKQQNGKYHDSLKSAERKCQKPKEEKAPEVGWCCINGEIPQMTERECKQQDGKYYDSVKSAERKCQKPKEEKAPEVGWCCINGEIPQMTERECKQQNGKYHDSLKSAERKCRKPNEEAIPEAGWCCVDYALYPFGKTDCENKNGQYFEGKESAQSSCRMPAKEAKKRTAAGWCCSDGKLAEGGPEACNVHAGHYFVSHEDAQQNCKSVLTLLGWCCINNKLQQSTVEECQEKNGTHYIDLQAAQQNCKAPEYFPVQIGGVTPSLQAITASASNASIKIEDITPGPGSKSEGGASDSIYGRVLALTGSGKEKVTGAPFSWTFPVIPIPDNNGIENLAVRGANNELYYFFYSTNYDWLAHNVSEQAGYKISGTPVGWLHKSGFLFDQYIAAAGDEGSLLVFNLKFGTGWVATNVSAKTGYKLTGALTWWETMNGSDKVDHLAGQSTNDDLIVFYRIGKGEWKAINVSTKTGQKIAGSAVSWKSINGTQTVEHLAAQSPAGDLLVFYWQPGVDWKVVNVSAITGQKVNSSATSWLSANGNQIVEHLAAKNSAGDLLVFYWQPGADWKAVNVTAITGQKIDSSPMSWLTQNGEETVEHLAAKGTNGKLYVFYWQPGVDWKLIDVTAKTGRKIESAPTSWISYNGKQPVEHIAATDGSGNLLIFYWMPWTDWGVTDASLKASKRVMYAGTPYGGVWRSNDYGGSWFQLIRPQPEQGAATQGGLGSPTIFDVLVSPEDPDLVYAVVYDQMRTTSKGGIYRSTNGGKFWSRVFPTPTMNANDYKVTQIRFAPDDSKILYAAVGKGVAISNGSGTGWETKETNSAVWHIAIGPKEPDGKRKIYACGDNRLYYSPDSGNKWMEEYAISAQSYPNVGQIYVCPFPTIGNGTAVQIMDVEPGHSDHLYIASAGLANGLRYFAEELDPSKPHVIYTEMEGVPCGTTVTLTDDHQQKLGETTRLIGCGEGSVWLGDFSNFKEGTSKTQRASWEHMPGPPVYFGGSTPSGRAYLKVHPIPGSYLLFFADRSHVHVSEGRPTIDGWHRLDGYDIADTWKDYKAGKAALQNRLRMHPDPHDIYVSSDFGFSLKAPTGVDPTYSKSMEIDECFGGRIWEVNDGGIYRSMDCGKTWESTYDGPKTLFPVNIAGLALPGEPVALYMGVGDDDDFMTRDGGKTWSSPKGQCGDCGPWFADPAVNIKVTEVGAPGRKGQAFFIYTNPSEDYPDTMNDNNKITFPYPDGSQFPTIEGARPLILSQPGAYNVIPPNNDLLTVRNVNSVNYLLRGFTQLLPLMTVWMSVGTSLPFTCPKVPGGFLACAGYQASGDYAQPTYYVGDGQRIWKSVYDDKGYVKQWKQIISGTTSARRFFVNPYDPRTIYIIDNNGIQRSDDGGDSWNPDINLTNALTVNNEYPTTCHRTEYCFCGGTHCVLNDMLFYRADPKKRFAAGIGGVFFSPDGITWQRLLDPVALPCLPDSLYFDALSHPGDNALYVACFGRGILKMYGVGP